jgi:hypothetical protein
VAALRIGELVPADDPPRLGRVVVLDRRLQVLAQRIRLAELPPEPAQEADLGGAAYRLRAQDQLPLSDIRRTLPHRPRSGSLRSNYAPIV